MIPVIEMRNITKTFPGIKANDNVSLELRPGEIHALLGENGAGKSTLMSVLFGLYPLDEGSILVHGEEVEIKNPNDANKLGIGMVHQHFKLLDNFSVLENIILGFEDTHRGFLKYDEAHQKVIALSEKYKLKVDPDALIRNISVGQQQRVEILKMLYRDADILIFDEPTAVLTPQEIDELLNIMRNLTEEGKSIILITHKLKEIRMIADRCTILRKGKGIGTVTVKDVTNEKLAEMMVGRKVIFNVDKGPSKPKEIVLEAEGLTVFDSLTRQSVVKDVSFKLREGEILTIAGIEGNGQTELVYGLTGLKPIASGKLLLHGEDATTWSIKKRNEEGIAHIPEDRQKYGLVLDFSLENNMILQQYNDSRFHHRGFFKFDAIRDYAERIIEKYDVRSGKGPLTYARSMSGGNQQKAILGREIERQTNIVIAVQPTRGLDVGAIEFIHNTLIKLRDEGKAVLLISLELDEVMTLSDRILVMYEGELVGAFDPKKTDEYELGLYMSGSKKTEVLS